MSDDSEEDLRQVLEESQQDLQDIIDDTEDNTNEGEETSSEDNTNEGEGTSEEGSSDGGDSDSGGDSEDEEEKEDTDEPTSKGIARAYRQKKKNKDKMPKDKKFAPPGRGKWDGIKKDGKLIGEVLYDMLIEGIERLMKAMIDIPLNFLDYVLYESYKTIKPYPPQEEDRKTAFDYGREIEKGYADKAGEGIGFYKKALEEVLNNIEKKKRGEPVDWVVFRNQPRWFDEAVDLERAAAADPSSAEGLRWEQFKNSDKIIEGRLSNEATYRIIATRVATFEEALKREEFELPSNIEKKLEEMSKLLEKEKIEPADLKQKMTLKITEMQAMINGGGYVNNTIKAQLDAMKTVAESSEEDVVKLKKEFNKPIAKIKDINPIPEHIKTLAREDYEKITANLDKIREKFKDNSDLKVEVMTQYVNGIIDSLNAAQDDVIKYEESNSFSKSKVGEKVKKGIFGLINKAGDRIDKNGKVLSSLKTQREKAENGIKAVRSAIDNFEIDNIKISEYADATKRSSVPSTDKAAMLRQMSSYFRSR